MAEDMNVRVVFSAEGIDTTVRDTQRLLYAMNAVRLSIRDIQDVMAGPTLQNVMWTAIQLTRVWTSLWRLVQAVNRKQKVGAALGVTNAAAGAAGGVAGGVAGGAAGGFLAGGALFPTLWFFATNPIAVAAVGVAAAMVGIVAWDMHQKRQYEDWIQRQRERAKSQGIEY